MFIWTVPVWKVQFFVDLKQLERNLRTVYADRTAMEAVSQANPATVRVLIGESEIF